MDSNMKKLSLKKLSLIGITSAILGGVVAYRATNRSNVVALMVKDQPVPTNSGKDWPLFGGTVSRNLVNLVDKNVPDFWSIEQGKNQNINWVADLGSKAYGGPIVYRGKIFVGTNNDSPRNPEIKDDKGIMMCFSEKTGELIWQAVHDKLPAGRVNDWPREGICSSPVVEGKKF